MNRLVDEMTVDELLSEVAARIHTIVGHACFLLGDDEELRKQAARATNELNHIGRNLKHLSSMLDDCRPMT